MNNHNTNFYSIEEVERTLKSTKEFEDGEQLYYFIGALRYLYDNNKEKDKEIERLKERCEYLQRSCERKEEQRDTARMEYMEQEDYKSRNEKARGMIRFIAYNSERPLTITELNKVYNILGGDDNE